MFFLLSKIVWFVFSPVNFVILLAGFSALLAFTRFARADSGATPGMKVK